MVVVRTTGVVAVVVRTGGVVVVVRTVGVVRETVGSLAGLVAGSLANVVSSCVRFPRTVVVEWAAGGGGALIHHFRLVAV